MIQNKFREIEDINKKIAD